MMRRMNAPETSLVDRLPAGPISPDGLLDLFVDWAAARGLELYPAQEEAILALLSGQHVVLNTPTGSGKSLVAMALHFAAYATGGRSFYTSPIKALVSEKFFDLCKQFGAANVGMLTGDASINANAPIIACTAEVLAAMALSEGEAASVHAVVMDEFHYYADPDRGMAWQLPLLLLPRVQFLLMSATLGDPRDIARRLEERTRRKVTLVTSAQRPVPLHFEYRDDPLLEVLQDLMKKGRAPIYVVSFTHRECAELAQSLTSLDFCTKEEKQAIAAELKGFRFDTPYGKDVRRFVAHGMGIHHAGLLPKYRLLVERLAQQGLLKMVLGTDTLGVGINVPIRTALFTKLAKYDGRKTRILSVRDFKQIAGRAGRKGFDDAGWVVCMAPEHVIENKKIAEKIATDPAKKKKLQYKKPPEQGYVHWDEDVFRGLIDRESEALESRFSVDHGMLINLLQRGDATSARRGGYGALIELIALSHEPPRRQHRLRRDAKAVFQTLRRAGIVEVVPREGARRGKTARVAPELQRDFSMYHSLSLFLIYALGHLSPDADAYPLQVLTLVESILEDPRVVLLRQQDVLRTEALAQMKAERIEYEERMEKLEKITWPMPDAELVFELFDLYAQGHPWVKKLAIQPKSVARDLYERYATFNEYVKLYGLERAEGVLLRHLSQVYKVLVQTVPEALKDDRIYSLIGYLRATLQRADGSLVRTWEAMLDGVPEEVVEVEAPKMLDISAHPKVFEARVRAEVLAIAHALAKRDYDEALGLIRHDAEDEWTAERFVDALRPFYAAYDRLVFDHRARQPGFTRMDKVEPKVWRVRQVLCDPMEDDVWYLDGIIDLRQDANPDGPLIALREIAG